jgi:PKD repeat protein
MNRTTTSTIAFLTSLAMLLSVGYLSGQCERVGWVASVTPGCSAKIIDLDDGKIYHAVSGHDDLIGGQTISFKAVPAAVPPGCSFGVGEVVSLLCISDMLPCFAHFGYYADANDKLQYNFIANIYDPNTQTCFWRFGDGTVAYGNNVRHGFPKKGQYQVCLNISDIFGCSVEFCETIMVEDEAENWCGYEMKVTAIGTQLMGELFPVDSINQGQIKSVYWYSSKSSNVIAQTPAFTAPLPGYGTYVVCVQYEVVNPDGTFTCTSAKCEELTVAEPGCINPGLADPTALCPTQSALYAPVCGCDGLTYGNECEAISSGLCSWWAGDCSAQNTGCEAKMEVSITEGSFTNGFTAQFVNQAAGDYTYTQLDFGDGSAMLEATNWDTIKHNYSAGGIFRSNLTTWKTGGCVSSVIELVVTDAFHLNTSNLPGQTDYVRPGDANGDGKANAYDLLHLGVGNYTIGAPRPEASTEWEPQFAPNWPETVDNQVNYKHLDCDGNGGVNEYDADVIGQHYTPIDSNEVSLLPNTPQIRIEFPVDTIVVDANVPAPVEIKGKVLLGSAVQPAFGIYGLAFSMLYPDFVAHNPEADYKSDFFGSPNHMLWLAKDNHSRSQLDLALTRKNGLQANGYGALAEVSFKADFIIVIDVAGRSENAVMPFTVPIRGIKAIDPFGRIKYISTPQSLDTVWIKLINTSGTQEAIAPHIKLSPNPAQDFVTLYFGDLSTQSVEILNVLGQVLARTETDAAPSLQLEVGHLAKGFHTLRINTSEGIIEKKLLLE